MKRRWLLGAIFATQLACSSELDYRSDRSEGDAPKGPEAGLAQAASTAPVELPTLAIKGAEGQPLIFKQRGPDDRGTLKIKMPDANFDAAEAFVVQGDKVRGKVFEVKAKRGGYFEAKVPRGVGYKVRLRLFRKGTFFARALTPDIVVGDIFLTAGQSNSSNAGTGRTTSRSGAAFMLTPQGSWQHAADPFLTTGDGSRGSSPWPTFADLYYWYLGVPVGIVSLGYGGTSLEEWQPGGKMYLYERLSAYARGFGAGGFRAILWHQGESDVFKMTRKVVYRGSLQTIIGSLRKDLNWKKMPFVVANTSWLGEKGWADFCVGLGGYPACADVIANAQRHVLEGQTSTVEKTHHVYLGPNTDELWQRTYRSASESYIHFNEYGNVMHGTRWYEALARRLPPIGK